MASAPDAAATFPETAAGDVVAGVPNFTGVVAVGPDFAGAALVKADDPAELFENQVILRAEILVAAMRLVGSIMYRCFGSGCRLAVPETCRDT